MTSRARQSNRPIPRRRVQQDQADKPSRTRYLSRVVVHARPGKRTQGILIAAGRAIPCALGRAGIVRRKREGDGGTPAGSLPLIQAFYRGDRGTRPVTGLPLVAIRRDLGWCDDPRAAAYNRPIPLPARAGHEAMWRADRLYDLVVDLAWNRGPIRRGRGSAIFLHIARDGFKPTEGCVALRPDDARRLLARLGPATRLVIA